MSRKQNWWSLLFAYICTEFGYRRVNDEIIYERRVLFT